MSFVLRIVSSGALLTEPPMSLLASHVHLLTLPLQPRVILATRNAAVYSYSSVV